MISPSIGHDRVGDRPVAAVAAAVVAEIVGRSSPDPGRGDAARPVPLSIHQALAPLLRRAERGDVMALAPGPTVDRVMSRLVELVTGAGGLAPAGLAPAGLAPDGPAVAGGTADAVFDREVASLVGAHLDDDPELARRAAEVRRAAALSETALELHHARLVTAPDGLAQEGPPPPGVDPLPSTFGRFPYLANYRLLTSAELAGLAHFARPRHLTFCGAGALPLTGVLCHRRTAASVRLVEIDPRTAELADRLRVRLERRGVVAPGALEVVTADAGEADLGATDVVIVASLVPRPVVDRIVGRLIERLGAEGERARWPVLVVRSASGLVARFAYDAVDPATVGLGVYRHAGTVAPIGREPDGGPPLLARAHRSVLNTSEFFVPVAGRGPART